MIDPAPATGHPPPHRAGPRTHRLHLDLALGLALALGLVLGIAPVAAAGAVGETPSFLIEAIRIEGVERASAGILLAESRLHEGRSYSERELAVAVRRIERLPFVLGAELALERGSDRGRYVLRIAVRETERWFFGGDVAFKHYDQRLKLDDTAYVSSLGAAEEKALVVDGTAGLRLFLGADAMVFLAADDEEGLRAGVTHHDLFARNVALTIAASHDVCCSRLVTPLAIDPELVNWTLGDSTDRLSLNLTVPLGINQTLRLDASRLESDLGGSDRVFPEPGDRLFGSDYTFGGDLVDERIVGRWVYDTTDDFLLPHTGIALSAGLEHRRFRVQGARSYDPELSFPQWPIVDLDRESIAAVFSASQVFALAERSTLITSLRGAIGTADDAAKVDPFDLDAPNAWEVAGVLRYGYDLLDPGQRVEWGDLRLEAWAEASYETIDPEDPGPAPLSRATLGVGVVWRNRWGVFRIGFSHSAFTRDRA